ncbi:hypothetical protein HanPSC8_Chr17g0784371 [Helianthus annuus]|nr:hypothetical protein HanPSC8_Chr17g0784371 [Helianthus annuus]
MSSYGTFHRSDDEGGGGFASGLTEVMVIAGGLVRFDQIVSNSVTSQIQQVLGASA